MSKKLTIDQKIDEAYELYLKGIIPRTTDDYTFSDGVPIGPWLSQYKYYLKNIGKKKAKAKILYEEREKRQENRYKEQYDQTMLEVINILVVHPEVLFKETGAELSTGRSVFDWIKCNRKKVLALANSGDEYAINLVDIMKQIKPDCFDFVGVVKDRVKNQLKR